VSNTPLPDPASPQAGPATNTPVAGTIAATATAEHSTHHHVDQNPHGKRLAILTLGALGVVYGDIGTSPLYALRECFKTEYGIAPSPDNVYGVLSLILWALILVVTTKYLVFILRADNRGEGGILALLALNLQKETQKRARRAALIALALFGAALLYGDGMITPAISVISAMEGLSVVSKDIFGPHVVLWLSVIILIALFSVQRLGTARVGAVFGPIMGLWFVTIAVLGVIEITRDPAVLAAINPVYGARFLIGHGKAGFIILGAVVLAITGGEALYADMGHFGRKPIRIAWFALVLPSLVLNYFGQGSLILRDPTVIENPFFHLAPGASLYLLVVIATCAAVIASQAMISGAFSITQQCVQLGYSPRVTIVHTSAREFGQIYIPEVNKALMVGCLLMALSFRNSTNLSSAYGIAVMGTMSCTTLLFSIVATSQLGWKPIQSILFLIVFFTIDITFFAATAIKVPGGGWVPLLAGAAIFTIMTSWKRGRMLLREKLNEASLPLDVFLEDIGKHPRYRVSGTAIFMTSEPSGVPTVLLHHLKHNKVLHEQVVLLSIMPADVPEVRGPDRVIMEPLQHGFYRVTAKAGFMETPDVKEMIAICNARGLRTKPLETTYYLGRERLIPKKRKRGDHGLKMAVWRKKLFAVLNRNAISATEYFGIPPNRVVELGTQIEI
jgi:KUP system potassium uptake protein